MALQHAAALLIVALASLYLFRRATRGRRGKGCHAAKSNSDRALRRLPFVPVDELRIQGTNPPSARQGEKSPQHL